MEISLTTGKLPDTQLFRQVRNYLRERKFKKVRIRFEYEVKGLGACYYGRTNIVAVTRRGVGESWSSYFSEDSVQPTSNGRDVKIDADICFVEIGGASGQAWVTLYLNPSHAPSFSSLLARSTGDPNKDRRVGEILEVFGAMIAVGRPEELERLRVSNDELAELVNLGYLTCLKGRLPEIINEPHVYRRRRLSRTYKLNGARLTPSGETFVSYCDERKQDSNS